MNTLLKWIGISSNVIATSLFILGAYLIGVPIIGLLLLPISLLIWLTAYPFFILATILGFNEYDKNARTATVTENGLALQRSNEEHRVIEWASISSIQNCLDPPFTYRKIILNTGEDVDIHKYDEDALRKKAHEHAIEFTSKRILIG